jgi:hypothetical protein
MGAKRTSGLPKSKQNTGLPRNTGTEGDGVEMFKGVCKAWPGGSSSVYWAAQQRGHSPRVHNSRRCPLSGF